MYGYLQNVKTNVSNAKRKRPKVIKSIAFSLFRVCGANLVNELCSFFSQASPPILSIMRDQPTLQHDCPCQKFYHKLETRAIQLQRFMINHIYFISSLIVSAIYVFSVKVISILSILVSLLGHELLLLIHSPTAITTHTLPHTPAITAAYDPNPARS